MHLCFVSRVFAMNPNRREEVSIIFSAALMVDRGRGEGAARIDCGEFMVRAAPWGFSHFSHFRSNNRVCCWRQNSQSQTAAASLRPPLFWLSSPVSNSGTRTSCSVSSLFAEACAVPTCQQGKSAPPAPRGLFCPSPLPRGLFLQLFRLVHSYQDTTEHLYRVCHWVMANVSDAYIRGTSEEET